MYDHDAMQQFTTHVDNAAFDAKPASSGSRRRRIWELPRNCHCPVVGVCLPLAALRKLANKVMGGHALANDYELHVGAVSECGSRNRISEMLQRDLEQRHAGVIVRFRDAKSSKAIAERWQLAVTQGDVTGAFWAALTHPRCDAELQKKLFHDIHMIQHQAGASTRVDLNKFDALQHENGVITRELAKVQERCTRLLGEKTREIEQHCSELLQTRTNAMSKDSTIAFLRADLAELKASVLELEARKRLKERIVVMGDRHRLQEVQIADLLRQLAQKILKLEPSQPPIPGSRAEIYTAMVRIPVRLHDKTVLCVGGRSGNIANYRDVIEKLGGKYVHHDGGLEDNIGLLDASIAAADLVICQTGCISHNAYWRVKDHCKRTGKHCLFVDNPSTSSLSKNIANSI